jgi:hypothetical protein
VGNTERMIRNGLSEFRVTQMDKSKKTDAVPAQTRKCAQTRTKKLFRGPTVVRDTASIGT